MTSGRPPILVTPPDPLVDRLKREFPGVDESEIARICARGRALLRPHVRHTLTDAVEWYARARLSRLGDREPADEVVSLMAALRETRR